MQRRVLIPIALAGLFLTGQAQADQIDGDWCSATGQHLHIDGPNIKIPSGARITGEYDRHGFRYTGPAGDPEQGQEIHMSQRSDELMYLWRRTNGQDGPPETWRRCSVTS